MCWSDVSTAIIHYVHLCIQYMLVNHVTFSFSQFITYRSLGSVSVCMHLLTRALPSCMINQYQQWRWQLYEYRVFFSDAWLFLVAIKDNRSWWTIMADGEIGIQFRYFVMILFVPDYRVIRWMSEPPSIQGHGPLVQAHNLSWYHLHDLPIESVHVGCPIISCMGLHLAD